MGTWDVWVFDELGIAGFAKTLVRFVTSGDNEVFCGMSALRSAMVLFQSLSHRRRQLLRFASLVPRSQAKPCNTERVRRMLEFDFRDPLR